MEIVSEGNMKVPAKTIHFSWKIFWGWLLGNFIGSVVGGIFLFFIAFISTGGFGSPMENPQVNYLRLFIQGLFMGGVFGLVLGICQGFVIMPYVKNTSTWILATTAGFAIGMASESIFPPPVYLS